MTKDYDDSNWREEYKGYTNNKRYIELLENGPKSLSQSWILGALQNEWKDMKGYDKDDPDENEVLIDVLACPINPADVLNIEGKYGVKAKLPARLGAECVGKVKKVGHLVKGFKEGDIVLPLDRENWVQQKIVDEKNLIMLPNDIDPIQLSMLKVNPATAYLMLKKYVKLQPGDWICLLYTSDAADE